MAFSILTLAPINWAALDTQKGRQQAIVTILSVIIGLVSLHLRWHLSLAAVILQALALILLVTLGRTTRFAIWC